VYTSGPIRERKKVQRLFALFHRDALGEVPRLVHVAPTQYGDMIGEELKWNDGQ
jgi:hypothetical protein